MKKIFVIQPVTTILIACFLVTGSYPAFAASVSSMISMGTRQNELGETVSVVDVKCVSASAEPRIIVSKEGDRNWCSQDIPDVCSRGKVSAAIKVCRSGFSAKVKEYQNSGGTMATTDVTTSQTNDTALDQAIPQDQIALDEVDLEKQSIEIERQKLEIRRQELELNKRKLELQRQSTTTQ